MIEQLRNYASDPMWADHAEVPKAILIKAADRIEALEAALREIAQKLTILNARWALEGGPFDGEWVSEVMALAEEQDK